MPADGWYGPAIDNWAQSDAGDHLGPVTVGVIHCTVSDTFRPSPTSYFGHQNYPHFAVWEDKVWQHISLRKAAKALANRTGGVQTNKEGVIQIEVVGHPDKPWSQRTKDTVRALMRFIESQTQIPRTTSVVFWAGKYGLDVPHRMTNTQWVNYKGWCAHQHVPENTHYDAGAIDILYLLDAVEAPMLIGAIKARYDALSQEMKDFIGPVMNHETPTPDNRGRYNHFLNGASIYWTPETGACLVYGAIRTAWAKHGWETSLLGYPLNEEYDTSVGRGQIFQGGEALWFAETGKVRAVVDLL